MIYERPIVERRGTLDMFFDRLPPRRAEAHVGADWRAKKLKEFVDNNSHLGGAHWDLDEVCRRLELSLSSRQARRLFKLSTGMGIKQYARNICLGFAAKQLQDTTSPVKSIAAEAGYQSTQHFTKRFKKMFGLSPSEFRRVWHRNDTAA